MIVCILSVIRPSIEGNINPGVDVDFVTSTTDYKKLAAGPKLAPEELDADYEKELKKYQASVSEVKSSLIGLIKFHNTCVTQVRV